MVNLENIVVVIADTLNYQDSIYAIKRTLRQITPKKVLFFTDMKNHSGNRINDLVTIVEIEKFKGVADYNSWIINKMPGLVDLLVDDYSHVLVIQHDGFVLDGTSWDPLFLEYDYIGAPWLYIDGRNVGNGGFSLRSKKLLELTKNLVVLGPEDECIGRLWRGSLELSGCKFAPVGVAKDFSFELNKPTMSTFGFHGIFHPPYKKTVCVKRMGAMGDVVQVEPVLRYFYEQGYKVYLKTSEPFYGLFDSQPYPVFPAEEKTSWDVYIDLDMAYENRPEMNHIEAYFDVFGEKEKANEPKIKYPGSFILEPKSYVVFHMDSREQVYRNPVIEWSDVINHFITNEDLKVVIIGHGGEAEVFSDITEAIHFKYLSTQELVKLIANAAYFVGVDSGPSHIAVACNVATQIFFGSVLPSKIHLPETLEKIWIYQGKCEHQGCWHVKGSTTGQPCLLGLEVPKCCIVKYP